MHAYERSPAQDTLFLQGFPIKFSQNAESGLADVMGKPQVAVEADTRSCGVSKNDLRDEDEVGSSLRVASTTTGLGVQGGSRGNWSVVGLDYD
ncbi:hypothetical protein NMY22_g5288 [Coprinellus aureogranulatus]|nr:hypothetical protein NMY22_g5288 [Coprinellus aureogranulatus]